MPSKIDDDFKLRLSESLENALNLGEGLIKIIDLNEEFEDKIYSSKMACTDCGYSITIRLSTSLTTIIWELAQNVKD